MRIKDKNKDVTLPDAHNYSKLRELGVGYLQEIADSVWTDYNLHDPGVTILELLCYSLVDLGYRTSFEISDLLTRNGDENPSVDGSFFLAHEILPNNPITIEDFRKLVLERVPGVKNIRFEAIDKMINRNEINDKRSQIEVKGFYKVIIELKDGFTSNTCRKVVGRNEEGRYATEFRKIDSLFYQKYIVNLFHKHRNICEDICIEDVKVLNPVKVGICAQIEIKQEVNVSAILNQINNKLQEYVSPTLSLYSLSEMISKGKTPDEIYQGVNPRYGFVDMDELKSFKQKTELYASDALNLIMGIEGVKSISHLHFVVSDEAQQLVTVDNGYKMTLKNGDNNTFCFQKLATSSTSLESDSSQESINSLTISINDIPFYSCVDSINEEDGSILNEESTEVPLSKKEDEPIYKYPLPEGKYKSIDKYYSIQNELPDIFKLGRNGISNHATDLRKAERWQLKAYLLFFEQILADYLAQLSSLNKMLSWKDIEEKSGIDLTYFHTVLSEQEITDVSAILKDYENGLSSLSTDNINKDRRNRFLNHLLARFNENFVDYSILSYCNLGKGQVLDFDQSQVINDKKYFLSQYAETSLKRSNSIDYTEDWDFSPIEKRIMSKLGVDNPAKPIAPKYVKKILKSGEKYYFEDNSDESFNTSFGIHIIEHILLASVDELDETTSLKLTKDDMGQIIENDPYSMQVTALLPGWLSICKKSSFRITIEQIIVEELPAHVSVKICWIDPYVMMKIEKSYASYLKEMKRTAFSKKDEAFKQSLASLIEEMHNIRNIYPPTVLGITEDMDRITRLDYSTLGESDSTKSGMNWQFSIKNK